MSNSVTTGNNLATDLMKLLTLALDERNYINFAIRIAYYRCAIEPLKGINFTCSPVLSGC